MAVGSFDQDTLEQVIATAIECGLATDDRRSQLLAHLPQRFVDKVELFDDPVAQLRADLEHLNGHPRLPDHHQPPLASWLQNAYLLTMPSDEARTFRTLRTRLVGSGRQQEILRSITRIKTITIPEAERVAKARDRARTPRAGALLGGRFSLERRLGQGAVAEVWRAQDVAAGIPVAVKILHRRWADQPLRRERFFSGARQMASFSHPHIVPVVMPEGEDTGILYSVFEYLDAGDLESALREGRIRRSTGLRALLLVASGVAAMHSMGVMHLDVKPQNILLGSDGRVMLGDFDRVRNQAIEGGSTTDTVESIFYLAPETFDETRTPGPTADVFSLGMTALFVLHGDKLPAWIVRRPAALLRRIDCPDAVRDVIARAIEIDPAARFTDVESMAMALQEALGRPSTALPRIAPLISAAPMAIKPARAPSAPGSGPMPRVSVPPRPHLSVGRTTDNLPPVARVTMELPEPEPEPDSGAFRALSQPIDLRLDGDDGPVSRDLPAPSIPPPSLPPPPMDLPPARTGELELEDSVDSALSVLDKAAAAALAEEFARADDGPAPTPTPEPEPTPPALIEPLPAPVNDRATARDRGPALIEPISGSIDLDASVIPADTSGPHASIPGDENRAPWTWIERSGGFMVAEPPESDALDVHSDRNSVPPEPNDPTVDPWRWMSRPLRPMDPELPNLPLPAPGPGATPVEAAPAPEHRSSRVLPPIPSIAEMAAEPDPEPDPVEPDPEPVEPEAPPEPPPEPEVSADRALPPAPTPAGPTADGALPADLISAEYMALAAPEAPPTPEPTADDAVLPPPATFEFEPDEPDESHEPDAPTERLVPVPPVHPDPPTEPYLPVAPVTADEPETVTLPLATPRRRTALWILGGGLAAAAVGLLAWRPWADDRGASGAGGAGEDPDGRQARTPDAAPSRAMDASAPDAGVPDAEVIPDASTPDRAPPDADVPDAEPDAAEPDAVVDAAIPDATPDAAPKPRRRRRRKPKRRRRRKPKPKPTPKPTPKPEPLIEIPDEIQQMLDE